MFYCSIGVTVTDLEGVDAGLREQLRATPNAIAKTTNLITHVGKPVAVSQVAIVHIGNNARARSM